MALASIAHAFRISYAATDRRQGESVFSTVHHAILGNNVCPLVRATPVAMHLRIAIDELQPEMWSAEKLEWLLIIWLF